MGKKIVIDKDIPCPPARGSQLGTYPFKKMEVGDSFFVTVEGRNEASIRTSILAMSLRHKPKRFTTRKEKDGIRTWRIE